MKKKTSRTIFPLEERKKQAQWLLLGEAALNKAEHDLQIVKDQLKALEAKHEKLANDYSCLLEEYSKLVDLNTATDANTNKN